MYYLFYWNGEYEQAQEALEMRFDFERQTLFKLKENLETVRDVERYREILRKSSLRNIWRQWKARQWETLRDIDNL